MCLTHFCRPIYRPVHTGDRPILVLTESVHTFLHLSCSPELGMLIVPFHHTRYKFPES